MTTNLSYTDTEIDDPDLRDDVCGSNPQCTWLDLFAGTRPTPFGLATFVAEERWLGGLRVGYRNESGRLDIAAVGRNITDENEPAYWGLEFRYGL